MGIDSTSRMVGREVKEEAGSPLVAILKLSGIVRSVRGQLRVRNRIYAHVLDEAWITRSIPDGERRRQQAAFLRGLLPTAIVGIAGLAATGLLATRSIRAEQRATQALQAARQRETQWKRALEALANERASKTKMLHMHSFPFCLSVEESLDCCSHCAGPKQRSSLIGMPE